MTKYQMASVVTAVLAFAAIMISIVIGVTVVEYHNSSRCIKGETMTVNELTVQTSKGSSR